MDMITQSELKILLAKKSSLKALRAQEKKLAEEVNSLTENLISKVRNGTRIREGKLTAYISKSIIKNRITMDLIATVLGQEKLSKLNECAGSSEKENLAIVDIATLNNN